MHNIHFLILNFYKVNKKGLSYSVILSLLYVLPLILADIYYLDDMGRITDGYSWTQADGRFASSLIMRSLSLSPYIVVNLYPYYTMISAAIIALSGYLLCYLFDIERNKVLKLSSLLLLINPFFLSNLAFKYDSLPMSLSIFVLIIPFFFVNKSHFIFTSTALLCSYICFCLYQPTVTGLFVIGSFYMFQYCKQDNIKSAIIFFLKLVIAAAGAYLLWRLSVYIMDIDLWGRGEFHFTDPEFYSIFLKQWSGLVDLMKSLSISYLIAVSLFFLLSMYAFIHYVSRLDFKRALFSILILLFAVVATFAINFATSYSAILPRMQTVYSFIFFILVYFLYELRGNWSKLRTLSLILLLFYSYMLSSLFGQALKHQDEYNNFIISQVSTYLVKKENPQLYLVGTIGVAPRNEMVMRFYPILKVLTPIYHDIDFIALCEFNKFNLISGEYGKTFMNREKVLKELHEYPVVDSNKYYILRAEENMFILDFNKSK